MIDKDDENYKAGYQAHWEYITFGIEPEYTPIQDGSPQDEAYMAGWSASERVKRWN